MLPTKIKITNDDISEAENILLPKGKTFDADACCYIKNLETVDLQAVPGSGKTTALLAKLLILNKYMPFDDGSGILVISHTNIAIEEIKNKIGKYCPKLFNYPNFVGTIQSFVDQFLATPFYVNKYKIKPYRIDSEIYDEKINKFKSNPYLYGFGIDKESFKYIQQILYASPRKFYDYRFGFNQKKEIILINSLNNSELDIKKPKGNSKKENYVDFTQVEKKDLYKWFFNFKKHLLVKERTLHFDDAYFLANIYLQKFPMVKKLLQKRFSFVFIDEMQDMDRHQYDLLESIFYADNIGQTKYQRIGDLNQAIHNDINSDDCWIPRTPTLKLTCSYRLTPETALVAKYFGLTFQEIHGVREKCNIKPHIIVFEKPEDVIFEFAKQIEKYDLSDNENPFCAIGWSGDYKYFDKEKKHVDSSKLTIKSYHNSFEKNNVNSRIDYGSLKDYLKYFKAEKYALAPIRNNILNAFVKILRTENIKDENDKSFTVGKLLSHVKESDFENYEDLKLNIFNWSFNIVKRNDVYSDIKAYILSTFKTLFSISTFSPETNSFITMDETSSYDEVSENEDNNLFRYKDIKIKVCNVHSVKGKTHAATLYMETFFYNDGGKSYESQRLEKQFYNNKLEVDPKIRVKQSAKMVYVGFSRPTHLLCFAVHKSRWEELKNTMPKNLWEVVEVKTTSENQISSPSP